MPSLNDLTAGTSGGYPDRVAALGKAEDPNTALVQQLADLQMKQMQLKKASCCSSASNPCWRSPLRPPGVELPTRARSPAR